MRRLKNDETGFSPVILIMALVIILLIGVVGFMVYRNHIKTIATIPKATTKVVTNVPVTSKPVESDPTTAWTVFKSEKGQFSLKYPSNWVQPLHPELCGPETFVRSLYLGPDANSVLKCGSDFFGQIDITSSPGQKSGLTYDFSSGYKNLIKRTVVVNGVNATRTSGIASGQPQSLGSYVDGTVVVEYIFTNSGNIYAAHYTQTPAGNNPSQDVLADFDLILTKTLSFN